jgi:hypothetical protein
MTIKPLLAIKTKMLLPLGEMSDLHARYDECLGSGHWSLQIGEKRTTKFSVVGNQQKGLTAKRECYQRLLAKAAPFIMVSRICLSVVPGICCKTRIMKLYFYLHYRRWKQENTRRF